MKTAKVFLSGALCISAFLLLVISCKKNVNSPGQSPAILLPDSTAPLQASPGQTGHLPLPEQYSMNCPGSPFYGDSVIYPSGNFGSPDEWISPVNSPAPGSYYAWPDGLVINDSTGAINITRSETGQRYYIGYVKKGTRDTCLNTLIISGAAYLDSIYVQNKAVKNMAQPYFNANSKLNNLCDQEGQCQWDLSGNANKQKIQLDEHTGIIDLDKTLQNGAFGKTPANGTTLNAVVYYILDDHNHALQSMQIRLMYYDRVSLIPVDLVTKIRNQRTDAMGNQILNNPSGTVKPPLIIITRFQ